MDVGEIGCCMAALLVCMLLMSLLGFLFVPLIDWWEVAGWQRVGG